MLIHDSQPDEISPPTVRPTTEQRPDRPPRRSGRSVYQDRVTLGAYGERLAAAHLIADGMVLLDRNWRCRYGELDLIARDPLPRPGALVFCEVKTRRSTRFGPPAQAVVGVKAARIRRLAAQWMNDTGIHMTQIRFDVITVMSRGADAEDELDHLRGAF